MTDERLVTSHAPEAQRIAGMLAALAEVFGEPMSLTRLEGYVAGLADVPFDLLREGIQHAVRGATFFPKPAEIRRHVDLAMSASALTTVDEFDPRVLVNCSACCDTGWMFTSPERDLFAGQADTVRRCACYQTNPKLTGRKHYGEDA